MLKWCKEFEVGIKKIDDEHKSIVEHFEVLYDKIRDGHGTQYYSELLDFLKMYVDSHFHNEEMLQQEIGYTGLETHKAIHEKFKKQVYELIDKSEKLQISNVDLIHLSLFIKEWLIHHILVEDKKVGLFLKQNGATS